MKRTFFFLCLLISSLAFPAAYKSITHGFRLAKLQLAPEGVGEISTDWLQQSFHYLNRGMQSYVFESDDKTLVLKLFRKARSLRRFERTAAACRLAFDLGKEETGLLCIHFARIPNLKLPLTLKDRLGRSHLIDLNTFCFALQKKTETFQEGFFHAKNIDALLDSYLTLIAHRAKKGIGNTDPRLMKNFGILEDQVLEIDFGNYVALLEDPSLEFSRCAQKMRAFLAKHRPNELSNYDQKVAIFRENL